MNNYQIILKLISSRISYPPSPPPPLCKKTVNLYAILLTLIHKEETEVSGGDFN